MKSTASLKSHSECERTRICSRNAFEALFIFVIIYERRNWRGKKWCKDEWSDYLIFWTWNPGLSAFYCVKLWIIKLISPEINLVSDTTPNEPTTYSFEFEKRSLNCDAKTCSTRENAFREHNKHRQSLSRMFIQSQTISLTFGSGQMVFYRAKEAKNTSENFARELWHTHTMRVDIDMNSDNIFV